MSDPVIDATDLGTYLNDPGIDTDRAMSLIVDAQALCEDVVSPLPDAAAVIVKRVAGRAYTTILSPRQQQIAASGGQFAGTSTGGVYLTQYDIADLRRMAGGGGAFSIDLLPAGYTLPVVSYGPDWDSPV